MGIRDFTGGDFEAASKFLGATRHAEHGERSYWHGSLELCAILARSDHGFVAAAADGTLTGLLLLASPREEDHNPDLRKHWLSQRTVLLAVCRTLGIDPAPGGEVTGSETDGTGCDPRIVAQLGKDARLVTLWQTNPVTCGEREQQELLERGFAWLSERGVETTDVRDEEPILPSTDKESALVGNILNEHGNAHGVEFVSYDYHIQKDGELVAGIVAWALGSDLHVDMLAVKKSERGRGLGGRLLSHVEEQARRDGCTTASVDTFSFQAPDYYPAHGYQEVFRYPLTDGTERIYFSKQL